MPKKKNKTKKQDKFDLTKISQLKILNYLNKM